MDLKTSIEHLPETKQAELNSILKVLNEFFQDIEMVILFGSYSTGKWVEDFYEEKGIKYEYKSDYDLLIVLNSNQKSDNEIFIENITKAIYSLNLPTPVSPIFHSIDFVNKKISDGSYFFNEIREQGILLYHSGKFNLANKRKLNFAELKANAERDFRNWFENANDFFRIAQSELSINKFKTSAFNLHQATERFYNTVQLVFTGYKPKTHNIEILAQKVTNLDTRFAAIFPRGTVQEKQYFILLKKAYIEARYNMDYVISEEALKYLAARVELLKSLTSRICQEKIESFREEK